MGVLEEPTNCEHLASVNMLYRADGNHWLIWHLVKLGSVETLSLIIGETVVWMKLS